MSLQPPVYAKRRLDALDLLSWMLRAGLGSPDEALAGVLHAALLGDHEGSAGGRRACELVERLWPDDDANPRRGAKR